MTGDILTDWHPIMIAARIARATKGKSQKEIAETLGISQQYLCDILKARRNLSPEVAVRLCRLGLNGRQLYIKQEDRRYEIQRRYESGEMKRP